MKEKEFNERLQLDDEIIQDEVIEKTLKKSMRKQINGRIYRTLLLILVGTIAFLWGTSLFLDSVFYDPSKRSPYLEDDLEYTEFHLLMDIYVGLNFPGRIYIPIFDAEESKGFGAYEIPAKLHNVGEYLVFDGSATTVFEVKRNRLEMDDVLDATNLVIEIDQFINDRNIGESKEYLKDMYGITPEKIEKIKQLPDSAVIKVMLSFPRTLTMEQTLDFMKNYPESNFWWIGIDTDEFFVKGVYDGINLQQTMGYGLTKECKEKYPSLMLYEDVRKYTAEELAECYRSRIQILLDNPDFLNMMLRSLGDPINVERKKQVLENRLGEATLGPRSIGVCASVTKQDFLDMIEQGTVKYVNIKDVKVSQWSK